MCGKETENIFNWIGGTRGEWLVNARNVENMPPSNSMTRQQWSPQERLVYKEEWRLIKIREPLSYSIVQPVNLIASPRERVDEKEISRMDKSFGPVYDKS